MCHPIITFQAATDRPSSANDLVEEICRARTRLEAVFRKLPPAHLLEPSEGGGWSVGEHLQHLTAWRRVLLDVLQGQLTAANIPTNPAFDFTPRSDLPVTAILNEFRGVHLDVLAEAAFLPDEDLTRPTGLPGFALGDLIAALTCEHDRRHREEITKRHGDTED